MNKREVASTKPEGGVEMNFHAVTKSLLKQTEPQRDLSRFAEQ
jgi:hypothetical protein